MKEMKILEISDKGQDYKAEICALRHNLSVAQGKNKELELQLRICVAEAEDRLEENKELKKEIEKLKIEVEKIHSRYEILDIR